jgi:hypothetical protein
MSPLQKTLDKRFQKVLQTPASFDLFVAIHDFIQHIELNQSLSNILSVRVKANQELDIPTKYNYLKQIYQGVEDINLKSTSDLGHARYAVMRDLNRIQGNDVSDSNLFWRKREVSRKLATVIYERLSSHLSVS